MIGGRRGGGSRDVREIRVLGVIVKNRIVRRRTREDFFSRKDTFPLSCSYLGKDKIFIEFHLAPRRSFNAITLYSRSPKAISSSPYDYVSTR